MIDKNKFWKMFKINFRRLHNVEYENDPVSDENLRAVFLHLFEMEEFFNHPHLIKQVEHKKLIPSFKKGLLLIGNFGNGKTAVMQTLSETVKFTPWSFTFHSTSKVAREYEGCTDGIKRLDFWRFHQSGRRYYDDLLLEDNASNYGIRNVMEIIIRDRCLNQAMTFGSCNYAPNDPTNSIEKALDVFGERYSPQVYDRLFEMFNIIEFKGKSRRK